jgi:hypothetical protein
MAFFKKVCSLLTVLKSREPLSLLGGIFTFQLVMAARVSYAMQQDESIEIIPHSASRVSPPAKSKSLEYAILHQLSRTPQDRRFTTKNHSAEQTFVGYKNKDHLNGPFDIDQYSKTTTHRSQPSSTGVSPFRQPSKEPFTELSTEKDGLRASKTSTQDSSSVFSLAEILKRIKKIQKSAWSSIKNHFPSLEIKTDFLTTILPKSITSKNSPELSAFEEAKKQINKEMKDFVSYKIDNHLASLCPELKPESITAAKKRLRLSSALEVILVLGLGELEETNCPFQKCLRILSFEQRSNQPIEWIKQNTLKSYAKLKTFVSTHFTLWNDLFEAHIKASYLQHIRLKILTIATEKLFIPHILEHFLLKETLSKKINPEDLKKCFSVICFNRLGCRKNYHGASESSDADIKFFYDPKCLAQAVNREALFIEEKNTIKNTITHLLLNIQQGFFEITGILIEIADFTVQSKSSGLAAIISQTDEIKFISTLADGWTLLFGKNPESYLSLIRDKKVNKHLDKHKFEQNLRQSLKTSHRSLSMLTHFRGYKNIATDTGDRFPDDLYHHRSDKTPHILSLKYQCMRLFDYSKTNPQAQLLNSVCLFLQAQKIDATFQQQQFWELIPQARMQVRQSLENSTQSYEDITTDELLKMMDTHPAVYAKLFAAACSVTRWRQNSSAMQSLCEHFFVQTETGPLTITPQLDVLQSKLLRATPVQKERWSYDFLRGIYDFSLDLFVHFEQNLVKAPPYDLRP